MTIKYLPIVGKTIRQGGTENLKNTRGRFFHLRCHTKRPNADMSSPKWQFREKHNFFPPHLRQLSNNFHEINSSNYSNWWHAFHHLRVCKLVVKLSSGYFKVHVMKNEQNTFFFTN